MGTEALRLLGATALAVGLGVVLVGLLRKPLRIAAGARAGYWIWMIVPAALVGALLPVPHGFVISRAALLYAQIDANLTATVSPHVLPQRRRQLVDLGLVVWISGFVTLGALTFRAPLALLPILRSSTWDPRGFYRGPVDVPLLLGAWRPQIIVPPDFDARYSRDEQELILAHERAHASRRDVAANLLGSLLLCAFWFNPLMYLAVGWLRLDQELACDAHVLGERAGARSRYAHALLKTQLVAQAAWRFPLGCHWKSIHPLTERVAMIQRPFPAMSRRLAGLSFVAAVTAATTYAAWAAGPASADGPRVWVDYSIRMTNPESPKFLIELNTQYVVASGEKINDDKDGKPLLHAGDWRLGCTPYLHDDGRATDWGDQKTRGIPIPAAGQILLECDIQHNGGAVQSISALAKDGSPVSLDIAEPGSALQYHLEVTPYSRAPAGAVDHLTRRPAQMGRDTESR